MTEKARAAFLASFGVRHYCALGCRVDIDQTMPEEARMRAARLAQQAHFRRMVHAREKKRRGIAS
jgi:hypothetical protein